MTTSLWPAPRAYEPVDAVVTLPGSKSITNRALVLSALADGPSTLRQPLRARDTLLMAAALRGLGTRIADMGEDWLVLPGDLRGPADVDCGLAGTVLRFLPAVAGLALGEVRFDGDPRARDRPIGPLLGALTTLGVQIDGERLPFVVHGGGAITGGEVVLDASTSSQLVSGILLAAPRFERGAVVHHDGAPMPSLPHVRMTVAMLRDRGIAIDDGVPNRWRVAPGPIEPLDIDVEPDLSNAAPFLAAALVTGGRITIPAWPARSVQPGNRLREIVETFGGRATHGPEGLVVTGGATINGVDLDLHEVGELAPVLAAIAALAVAPSRLRGIAHLRGHETDRLAALAKELRELGALVEETSDGLAITPRRLTGGVVRTYDDHRIATAAAVLGLVVAGVEVENIGTTEKTLPAFASRWRAMLGNAR